MVWTTLGTTCGRCHNLVGIPGRSPYVTPRGSAGLKKGIYGCRPEFRGQGRFTGVYNNPANIFRAACSVMDYTPPNSVSLRWLTRHFPKKVTRRSNFGQQRCTRLILEHEKQPTRPALLSFSDLNETLFFQVDCLLFFRGTTKDFFPLQKWPDPIFSCPWEESGQDTGISKKGLQSVGQVWLHHWQWKENFRWAAATL